MSTVSQPTLDEFTTQAKTWLEANATRKMATSGQEAPWGTGEFSVSIFHALSFDEEQALLNSITAWQKKKAEKGYHAITSPTEFGGLGLSKEYARAFSKLESHYETPTRHETFSVTIGLIAPTIAKFGTLEQKERWVGEFLATKSLCCQLFSEPGAGSDLASDQCSRRRGRRHRG